MQVDPQVQLLQAFTEPQVDITCCNSTSAGLVYTYGKCGSGANELTDQGICVQGVPEPGLQIA